MAEEAQKNTKQDKIYTILGAIVCVGIAIWLGSGIFGSKNPDEGDNSSNSDKTTQSQVVEGSTLTKSAIEEICEDAKYGVADGYDVVAVSGYDFQTYDTGTYDKDGNLIIQAMWNGKRKSDKETVKYWCYISGADDKNITVHYISVGNNSDRKDVWKTQKDLNFNQYDNSGNPEYPELH